MSSKRRIRRNACKGKVRHADQHGAKVAIRVLVRSMQGRIGLMRAYPCPFCSGWHIGHVDKVKW